MPKFAPLPTETARLERLDIGQAMWPRKTTFEVVGGFCLGASSIVGGAALGVGFGAAGAVIGGLLGAVIFALTKVKRRSHA